MPWYLYWLGIIVVLFDRNEHAIGYVKVITAVGLLYAFGILCNWPYFISGPLPDFLEHFPLEWWMTLAGLIVLGFSIAIAFNVWKWEFDRREKKAALIREAEARGELII
jgi:hypothetical protein